MPDLERLQAGDSREWDAAFAELHIPEVAWSTVHRILARRWPQFIEDVRQQALVKFVRAIRRCQSPEHLLPLLRKIAHDEAISFSRRAAFRREVRQEDQGELLNAPPAETENRDRLREQVAEQLNLDNFDLARVLTVLREQLHLDALDASILEEHILKGLTQAQLSQVTEIPEGTIARRKSELVRRIRKFLGGRI
jgi:RNA polymerase sigma factor (sigma-70 family)